MKYLGIPAILVFAIVGTCALALTDELPGLVLALPFLGLCWLGYEYHLVFNKKVPLQAVKA